MFSQHAQQKESGTGQVQSHTNKQESKDRQETDQVTPPRVTITSVFASNNGMMLEPGPEL
eukprot:10280726-Heterocapsa_arctica.AAC.1